LTALLISLSLECVFANSHSLPSLICHRHGFENASACSTADPYAAS